MDGEASPPASGTPAAKTESGSSRGVGRPPQVRENSLIHRLECILNVQYGKMTLQQATDAYDISSRTFYRWLRSKDRLIKLTGYSEAEFATKNGVRGLPGPLRPQSPMSNSNNFAKNATRMTPTFSSANVAPKVPTGCSTSVMKVQTHRRVSAPAQVDPMSTSPVTVSGHMSSSSLSKPVQIRFPPLVPTVIPSDTSASAVPSQRRVPRIHRGTVLPDPIPTRTTAVFPSSVNSLLGIAQNELPAGQLSSRGRSGNLLERPLRILPASSRITKPGHGSHAIFGSAHRPSGQQYRGQNSKNIFYVHSGQTKQPVGTQNVQQGQVGGSARGAGWTRGMHAPSMVNLFAPNTSAPAVQRATAYHNAVPQRYAQLNSALREFLAQRQVGHIGRRSGPPTADRTGPIKRQLEIMKGRRKIVLVFYGKVLISDIKSSICRRFGLLSNMQWALTNENGEEVIISDGMPSGLYKINVFY